MKKILFALAPIALIAGFAYTYGDVLPIGRELPKATLKMQAVSGKEISIKDVVKDKGVLVMFSCNTCPFVVENQQRTVEIAKLAEKLNVGVILLNSNEGQRNNEDSYSNMRAYAKDQQYNFNYVIDKNSEMANALGANRTPECFLFDKNLKLVYHGAIDDNPGDQSAVVRHHLQEALQQLSEGKDITIKESKSVGCTIKRIK